ncbi:MAG TPA: UDP-N-acetylmuramoyl-tripeptide--D-alanyl-D-alanine ligase, partial [Acidimicrobiia bacterium]|nr:UDP-N-acetylmuramoyl-tripeptide--D-alanyl-D-alanine ligase [Acidimicrobiia bacterium]
NWTLATVAAATGGVANGDSQMPVHSVSTDSRSVEVGSVFVAIRGEHHDGHDYAADAVAAGAVAALVEHGTHTDLIPRIDVEDTGRALRDLAAYRRSELEMPVVAITGSTGKTSTKDLLAAAIPGSWASPRSYNNEVGVPLTVLTAPDDATALVLEVGSRGPGHIAWLMPAIRPSVAVITNLGVVHFETFGSRDAVADGKWELVAGLSEGGIAVLPAEEPRLRRPHPGPTITFGEDPTALFRISSISTDMEGRPSFNLHACGRVVPVTLAMAGSHNAHNAAAAFAAATAIGIDQEIAADGMANAVASPWRMEIHKGRFTVVNDAYNANPTSMEAALRTVASMPGRSFAILGEMAELGSIATEEHRRIGRLASDLDFEGVVTVGHDHGLADAAGGLNMTDPDVALEYVLGRVGEGDVVLVKASRSVGLESLARQLVEEAGS